MFYNQPLAVRFGTEFLRHIDPVWDSLDIAVARVRASGMAYLSASLAGFLQHGGKLSTVVGIDLENTTREGLQALLDLEQYGRCETFVYHNEGDSVFHPKLYLWQNEEKARLIVGSNNITRAGLFVNVEAGLQIDAAVDADVVVQTLDALASWKDVTSGLVKRLDSDLLKRLIAGRYVPSEAAVQKAIAGKRSARATQSGAPVFRSKRFVAPPYPTPVPPPAPTNATGPAARQTSEATADAGATTRPGVPGRVLLMRLRKVSVTERPTQAQIPLPVLDTFFAGATSVRSNQSGELHKIIETSARGRRNTNRLEIPEMRSFDQPVARFEQTPAEIAYEAYDVGSAQGNQIFRTLQDGRANGSTQLSISNPARATWWRFI